MSKEVAIKLESGKFIVRTRTNSNTWDNYIKTEDSCKRLINDKTKIITIGETMIYLERD